MVRKSAFLTLMLATSLVASASTALASDRSASRPAPKQAVLFTVNAQLTGQMAALVFVRDQVFRGFGFVRSLGIGKLAPPGEVFETQTVDGPDGIDPLGVKGGTIRNDGPPVAPANNRLP